MTEFVVLRPKIYSYLTHDSDEIKKVKGTKKYAIHWKRKFENYKSCLEKTQLKNEINYLEKNKLNVNDLRENYKEFRKNNKLMLKLQ